MATAPEFEHDPARPLARSLQGFSEERRSLFVVRNHWIDEEARFALTLFAAI